MTELQLQQAEFAKGVKILYSAFTEYSARLLEFQKAQAYQNHEIKYMIQLKNGLGLLQRSSSPQVQQPQGINSAIVCDEMTLDNDTTMSSSRRGV